MSARENTKQVLEHLLAELYSREARGHQTFGDSYLIAQDNQYLGKITSNTYENDSILNQYGPYGSKYSMTSIFNPYSQYGSPYSMQSVNNPYITTPPKLYINGAFKGLVTANKYIPNRIPTTTFLYMLQKQLPALISGNITMSINEARRLQQESYIEGHDGTFLGNLNPNPFDNESIFNKFETYGSMFSQESIFNRFSTYGDKFSQLSAYNEFANNPPKIYLRGNLFSYLTKNRRFDNRIDPDNILSWAKKNIRYEIV